MNLIDNIKNFFRSSNSSKPQHRSSNVVTVGEPWGGDENVGDFGMKIAAVFRCVDIVSGTVASLALTPRKWQGNKLKGFFKVDNFSKLYTLLTLRPNKRLNAFDFIKNLVSITLLHGNGYVLPVYEDAGLKELILLSPGSVNYDKLNDKYHVTDTLNGVLTEATRLSILKTLVWTAVIQVFRRFILLLKY